MQLSVLLRYRHLLIELTKREFSDRYAQQAIGTLWAWAHPLLLMVIYTLVFHHIFAFRFDQESNLPLDYTAYLLSGLVPWLAIQDVLGRGSDAVLSHTSFIKQTAFPTIVLPLKRALSSMPLYLVSTFFLTLYQLVMFRTLPATMLLLPFYFFFLVMMAAGLTLVLSAVGVFFRDTREFITIFCAANLYLMPILFLPGKSPHILEWIFTLNPFTPMIYVSQDIMFFGKIAHPYAWITFPILSIFVFVFGWQLFERLKNHFSEAI